MDAVLTQSLCGVSNIQIIFDIPLELSSTPGGWSPIDTKGKTKYKAKENAKTVILLPIQSPPYLAGCQLGFFFASNYVTFYAKQL